MKMIAPTVDVSVKDKSRDVDVFKVMIQGLRKKYDISRSFVYLKG